MLVCRASAMTEQDLALGLSRMVRVFSRLATLEGTGATCVEVRMTKSKGVKKPKWTPDEDAVVVQLWETKTSTEIMPLLAGRNAAAIKKRAQFLGLSKNGLHRDPANAFWAKVRKVGGEGCWTWMGTKTKGDGKRRLAGYGMVGGNKVLGKGWYAHRLSYFLTHGDFDRSLDVLHKCDNPSCVNPEHLYLGTDSDNQRDVIARKRRPTVLDENKVRQIRAWVGEGVAQVEIGKRLGIARTLVYSIARGVSWRWLK